MAFSSLSGPSHIPVSNGFGILKDFIDNKSVPHSLMVKHLLKSLVGGLEIIPREFSFPGNSHSLPLLALSSPTDLFSTTAGCWIFPSAGFHGNIFCSSSSGRKQLSGEDEICRFGIFLFSSFFPGLQLKGLCLGELGILEFLGIAGWKIQVIKQLLD